MLVCRCRFLVLHRIHKFYGLVPLQSSAPTPYDKATRRKNHRRNSRIERFGSSFEHMNGKSQNDSYHRRHEHSHEYGERKVGEFVGHALANPGQYPSGHRSIGSLLERGRNSRPESVVSIDPVDDTAHDQCTEQTCPIVVVFIDKLRYQMFSFTSVYNNMRRVFRSDARMTRLRQR